MSSVFADDDARRYGYFDAMIDRASRVCKLTQLRHEKEFDQNKSCGEGRAPKPEIDCVYYEGTYYRFQQGRLFYYDPDAECFRLSSVDRRWFNHVKH